MLEHLQPERVFYYFEQICGIPHGSGNTKQISDYCVNFAKEQGLEYHQDDDNNVIIIKEASAGYENAGPVIIQGHLDMVCEKTADCNKDMSKEGLDIYIDGDEVRAKNTTLGGDDGIAVAMAMAILEDKSLCHPRVEAVFTVDEEIGLLGAGNPGAGVWMFILSMIVYGVAFDFFNISGSLYVEKETVPEIRASAQGVFMIMTNGFGAFIGSYVAGWVVDKWGWPLSWYIFAGYALVVAILFALVFRYKHNPNESVEVKH